MKNQTQYLKLLLEKSGHLNPYAEKTSEKAPDFGGYIKIDGKIYRLACWIKETKTGKKTLSLKASEANQDGTIKPNQL
jgi:uncharacterized protein (DUF736 family)